MKSTKPRLVLRLCVTTDNNFFFVIKTPGGYQNILDRAFGSFSKLTTGHFFIRCSRLSFCFFISFFFFLSLQSNVKCKTLEKKQKSYEKQENFSFSGRKVVCLPF